MDALYFLEGYKKSLKLIRLLEAEKNKVRELSQKITVDISKEHVQTSGNKDIVGSIAVKLAVLDKDIEDANINANEEAVAIINMINSLEDPEEAHILMLKHIGMKEHRDISRSLLISERTEYRKYKAALKHLQKAINKMAVGGS